MVLPAAKHCISLPDAPDKFPYRIDDAPTGGLLPIRFTSVENLPPKDKYFLGDKSENGLVLRRRYRLLVGNTKQTLTICVRDFLGHFDG